MKLATLAGPGRDGRLVVVSRDLVRAVEVPRIAPSLQAALDDWAALEPALRQAAERLERDELDDDEVVAFDPAACAAPLPRAYQFADGSAYLNHVALVRRARGADLPQELLDDPLMYQGASDGFLGPTEPIAGRRRGLRHRPRGRGRGDHRRRADGRRARRGARPRQARDAAQRRLAAPPDPGRARQGLRLLPGQAAQRLLAGRGEPGRARRRLAGRQAARCRCAPRSTARSSAIRTPASTCSSTSAA